MTVLLMYAITLRILNKKNPISATILTKEAEDISAAVKFFPGSPSTIFVIDDTHSKLTADGYYASIGA